MLLRRKKAQAMAEFVIILPVLILLLAGVVQFAAFSVTKIKLEMLDREVMRYITTVDSDKDKESVEAFGLEMGEKMGLEKEKLDINIEAWKPGKGDSPFTNLGFVNSIIGAAWKNVKVTYEQPLSSLFSAITGKDSITIEAVVFTARADSFTIMKTSLEKWLGSFIGGK